MKTNILFKIFIVVAIMSMCLLIGSYGADTAKEIYQEKKQSDQKQKETDDKN